MKSLFISTETALSALRQQLAEFGLHPSDWNLIKDEKNQFIIQNKDESSFYFMGLIQRTDGKDVWKNIRLVSL